MPSLLPRSPRQAPRQLWRRPPHRYNGALEPRSAGRARARASWGVSSRSRRAVRDPARALAYVSRVTRALHRSCRHSPILLTGSAARFTKEGDIQAFWSTASNAPCESVAGGGDGAFVAEAPLCAHPRTLHVVSIPDANVGNHVYFVS